METILKKRIKTWFANLTIDTFQVFYDKEYDLEIKMTIGLVNKEKYVDLVQEVYNETKTSYTDFLGAIKFKTAKQLK